MNLTRRELLQGSLAVSVSMILPNGLTLGCNSKKNMIHDVYFNGYTKEFFVRFDLLNELAAKEICNRLGVEYNKHNRSVIFDPNFYSVPFMFHLEELLAPPEHNMYIRFSLEHDCRSKDGYLIRTYWYSKYELDRKFRNANNI